MLTAETAITSVTPRAAVADTIDVVKTTTTTESYSVDALKRQRADLLASKVTQAAQIDARVAEIDQILTSAGIAVDAPAPVPASPVVAG
jgi:hypothetical protein